jgi:hypothetical protein
MMALHGTEVKQNESGVVTGSGRICCHNDAERCKGGAVKALTIRNIPHRLADAIKRRAEESHTGLSRALLSLLEEQVGGRRESRKKKRRDLSYIAGSWNEQEVRQFSEALAQQRRIDPEIWKGEFRSSTRRKERRAG